MIAIRVLSGVLTMLAAACALLSPSLGENAEPAPSFQAHVDMKTFMEHVLTPAAKIVWSVNAVMIDEKGEHGPLPQDARRLGTDRQRRRDACRSHQRIDDSAAGARSAVERLRQKVGGRCEQGLSGG